MCEQIVKGKGTSDQGVAMLALSAPGKRPSILQMTPLVNTFNIRGTKLEAVTLNLNSIGGSLPIHQLLAKSEYKNATESYFFFYFDGKIKEVNICKLNQTLPDLSYINSHARRTFQRCLS